MRAPAASLRLVPPPPSLRAAERRPVPAAKPIPTPVPKPLPWLRRLFTRREPTAYQRCLAIHIHYASPHRTLS
jgi:hypothetical protein